MIVYEDSHHSNYAAVYAAINCIDGRMQYGSAYKRRFNRGDILAFIDHIQRRFKDKKLAILFDNASIHRGDEMNLKLAEHNITSLYMCSYSPD